MPRNLNRLTAAASRQAALQDLLFVFRQLKDYSPPPSVLNLRKGAGHKKIDQATQRLINWAKEQGIEIKLPEGWKEV